VEDKVGKKRKKYSKEKKEVLHFAGKYSNFIRRALSFWSGRNFKRKERSRGCRDKNCIGGKEEIAADILLRKAELSRGYDGNWWEEKGDIKKVTRSYEKNPEINGTSC